MTLANDQELANTKRKLTLLENQIEIARTRPQTDLNAASLRSLTQLANQLREEIIRYPAITERFNDCEISHLPFLLTATDDVHRIHVEQRSLKS